MITFRVRHCSSLGIVIQSNMGFAVKSLIESDLEFQVPVVNPVIYNPGNPSITGIRRISSGVADVSFEFAKYTRMQVDYPRVSAVQIHSALCEGFYETMGLFAAENALPFGIDLDYVCKTAFYWTLLKVDILYRKEMKPNEKCVIRFEIVDISAQRFRRKQCSVTMNFTGYISGQMTELLSDPPLFIE